MYEQFTELAQVYHAPVVSEVSLLRMIASIHRWVNDTDFTLYDHASGAVAVEHASEYLAPEAHKRLAAVLVKLYQGRHH